MRREFKMTEEQPGRILDACKPVPYIVVGGIPPRSPTQNANDAWRALGEELGFDGMSVRPVPGKGDRYFTADAAEPPASPQSDDEAVVMDATEPADPVFDPAEAARARGANAIAFAVAGAASRERKTRLRHVAETLRADATNAEVGASRRDWMDAAVALDGALDEFEAGGGGGAP